MKAIGKWAALAAVVLTLGSGAAAARDAEADPARVTKPEWMQKPSAEDFAHVYPAAAREAGREGRATIECGVAESGSLTNCRIVSEEPEGDGFGPAALAMAWQFKMKPKTVAGQPVAGGVVRIPVRFTLAENEQAEPWSTVGQIMLGVLAAMLAFAYVACVVAPVGLICHGLRVWPGWSALMLLPAVNVLLLWALGLKALARRRAAELGKS